MNIYIDMDDVLCDTAGAYTHLLAHEFGKTVSFEDIFSFNLQQSFDLDDDENRRLFTRGHEPDFINNLRPMDRMLAVLQDWRKKGHHISVVTGRHTSTWSQSLKWLEAQKVPYHSFIMVDKYGWSETDERIAISLDELSTIEFHIGVEDSPKMADFLSARMDLPLLLFDRPWNRDYTTNSTTVRCHDWQSVNTALDRLNLG